MVALRVVTLNLRRDVEADGAQRWAARRDVVARLIADEAPDAIATQEGLPHQLVDLDARLPGFARVGRGRSVEASDEACALYYRSERLRVRAWGDLWLSDEPERPGSATWGNRHPRLVTWARLLDRASGSDVTLASTHFDHESPYARERSARFLSERFAGAIVAGDLNAAPDDAAYAHLRTAGWEDGGASAPTFHGFTGRAYAHLDHVLAPPRHTIRQVRVVGRVERGVHASDHHAVVADLASRG